jgi:flavin-dependent dehydrogenase
VATFRTLPGMEGRLRGTRGVADQFRQPYGPGWALTGDAGCLKDSSTGLGMGDALHQSFWLAEALDAALNGGDWEASLGAFQQRRAKALLPSYRATLR